MSSWAFYSYGRKHFNRKGWLRSPRLDVGSDLSGKVFVVTGANSGIGENLVGNLFSRNARVYMVCRNEERANKAREAIIAAHGGHAADNLRVVVADCGLHDEVAKVAEQVSAKEPHIDGLVCNAGVMAHERKLNSEGVENTFAVHFLCGTYAMGKQFMPLLQKSADPRVVVVTSGGMYSTRLDRFSAGLTGYPGSKFNANLAYAKAKRAQVVLVEAWAKEHPAIKFVSSHPGWTKTPALQDAYGSATQWFLSPLRSPAEGAEGMIWLAGAAGSDLESGAVYLDGRVEPKHLHKSTHSKQGHVDAFLAELSAHEDQWSPRTYVQT